MIQIILMLISFSLGIYKTEKNHACDLSCALDIDQSQALTVAEFTHSLIENQWLAAQSANQWEISYASDPFSSVLETTASIDLDGQSAPYAHLLLYTSHLGTVQINPDDLAFADIEKIQVRSNLTILDTLLIYGLPASGEVLPLYTQADSERWNPCEATSHYIAYYKEKDMVILSTVPRPLLIHLWTNPVYLNYLIGDTLEDYRRFYSWRYYKMDHISCMQD